MINKNKKYSIYFFYELINITIFAFENQFN